MHIATIAFCLFLAAANVFAADDYVLTSVSSTPANGDIAISASYGNNGEIVLVSPSECEEIRRFSIGSPVYAVANATASPGFVWAALGSTLALMSLDNGSLAYSSDTLAGAAITGISQSANGKHVLVWGGNRAALLEYADNNVSVLWAEQFDSNINTAIINQTGGNCYLAGDDLSIVGIRGGQLRRYALDAPILSVALDSARSLLYIAGEKGIVRYDPKDSVFTRLTAIPANSIRYTAGSNRIEVLGNGHLSNYSYPDFKLLSVHQSDGIGMEQIAQSGTLIYSNNTLGVYNSKNNSKAGYIRVTDLGTGFVSAGGAYKGNKSFMDSMAGMSGFQPSENACTEIRTATGSKAAPTQVASARPIASPQQPIQDNPPATSTPKPITAKPAAIDSPDNSTMADTNNDNQTKARHSDNASRSDNASTATVDDNMSINAADEVNPPGVNPLDYVPPVFTPADNASNANKDSVPQGRNPGIKASPSTDIPVTKNQPESGQSGVEIPVVIATPTAPTVQAPTVSAPTVQTPAQSSGIQIPSWVMNPTTLPSYSTVATGANPAAALAAGKLKIRDDVARSIMRTMLEDDFVKALNEDVRKRLLWMVAGRTGQTAADYTMQTGMWQSPNNSYYVLANITEDAVKQIYDPILKEELDILKAQGNAAYMDREAYKWN